MKGGPNSLKAPTDDIEWITNIEIDEKQMTIGTSKEGVSITFPKPRSFSAYRDYFNGEIGPMEFANELFEIGDYDIDISPGQSRFDSPLLNFIISHHPGYISQWPDELYPIYRN